MRSSAWPHAFVIDCYYLEHTSPLVLMLPLASVPLILTCAIDGKAVCVWKPQAGELLRKYDAAEVLVGAPAPPAPGDADASNAGAEAAVACGCEVVGKRLVALGARGRGTVHFCTPSVSGLDFHPELTVALPRGAPAAVALAYSDAAATLCALLAGGEGVALLPAREAREGGRGFGAPALIRLNAPEPALRAPDGEGDVQKSAKRVKTDGAVEAS